MTKTNKSKKQTYTVQAKVKAIIGVSISADSLDDAMAQTKAMIDDQFVQYNGEVMDCNFKILGVYQDDWI